MCLCGMCVLRGSVERLGDVEYSLKKGHNWGFRRR